MARSSADAAPPDARPADRAARPRHNSNRTAAGATLAAGLLAGVVLLIGTVGPPLFGQGVFLGSDAVSAAYPWRAFMDPAVEDIAHHGPIGDTVDAGFP